MLWLLKFFFSSTYPANKVSISIETNDWWHTCCWWLINLDLNLASFKLFQCVFSYFNGKVPTRTLICVRCVFRNVRLYLCGILTYRHRTLSICFLCTVKQQTELFWSNLDFFFLGGAAEQQKSRPPATARGASVNLCLFVWVESVWCIFKWDQCLLTELSYL